MFVVFAFFSAIGGLGGAEPPVDCAFSAPLLESTDETKNTTVKRRMDLLRMEHLPSRFRVWRAMQVVFESRRTAGLVVNRSTAWRVSPARTNILTVFQIGRASC